ncbi:hypothetical protein KKF59_00350 [Patescibacteria group bacterium]|nr:hypothetical protein [Patescibacteria group bacterium]MBU1034307.1 hypothetical protein [Patescibacteria group bacterium]MBU1629571.1 hypothetical protein [Patescibacteria group bacterium]MBU1907567.1 hypothetical protein [Patescibacteria group bacterium]
MPSIISLWTKLFPFKRLPSIDRFHLETVTNPRELDFGEILPIEIRYVLSINPSRHETFRKLLEKGYGLGVRTVKKTPEKVLLAVDRISRRSQHNTIMPWLEKLLRYEELPVWSEEELRTAEDADVNLYAEARTIIEQRFEFKKIVLVSLNNQCLTEREQELMREVNTDLYPFAIDSIINQVTFDNAHTRTETAQTIIKALLIIGPIAHALEHVLSGIGKVFAATADDLLSEAAELFALRGSGFTWRQLAKRSKILVPVFLLATYGAFQVEPLVREGRTALAGAIFGLSAVALSLTTALQSVKMYHHAFSSLAREGKLKLEPGKGLWRYALLQDFTNPARLGLFIGALTSPLAAAVVFSFFPQLTRNGWVLALLGSVESIVAALTVMAAKRINRALFTRRIMRVIKASFAPLNRSN